MFSSPNTLLFALLGGILPALFWLWFWLREDRLHPEPRKIIIRTFLVGMIAVPIVLPLEKVASVYLPTGIATILIWATIEELIKFTGTYFSALRSRDYDEPIDALIYLITGALGFAALENTLFIINPLLSGDISNGIITGNLRFIGASLLHVITAGTIGSFMAFAFYKSRKHKKLPLIIGMGTAITLHTLFNFSIIKSESGLTIAIFSIVWVTIIFLLLVFEKVKQITPKI